MPQKTERSSKQQHLERLQAVRPSQPSVLIIDHVPWESAGWIQDSLDEVGLPTLEQNFVAQKKPDIPGVKDAGELEGFAGIVVMGGPMGAQDFDEHPALKAEMKLIRNAIGLGKPVLGVCLGHQLIALALGADLKKSKHAEIGFHQVTRIAQHDYFSMPDQTETVLGWHVDSVTLPKGATLLASSAETKNQAFTYGSALGLQFHMEVTAAMIEEWLSSKQMTAGLKKSQIAQIRDDYEKYGPHMQNAADVVFSGFAARCLTQSKQAGQAANK